MLRKGTSHSFTFFQQPHANHWSATQKANEEDLPFTHWFCRAAWKAALQANRKMPNCRVLKHPLETRPTTNGNSKTIIHVARLFRAAKSLAGLETRRGSNSSVMLMPQPACAAAVENP
jgi:hypothetical protein